MAASKPKVHSFAVVRDDLRVAYVARKAHSVISLDWAAVAFYILRPELHEPLLGASPFLRIEWIRTRTAALGGQWIGPESGQPLRRAGIG